MTRAIPGVPALMVALLLLTALAFAPMLSWADEVAGQEAAVAGQQASNGQAGENVPGEDALPGDAAAEGVSEAAEDAPACPEGDGMEAPSATEAPASAVGDNGEPASKPETGDAAEPDAPSDVSPLADAPQAVDAVEPGVEPGHDAPQEAGAPAEPQQEERPAERPTIQPAPEAAAAVASVPAAPAAASRAAQVDSPETRPAAAQPSAKPATVAKPAKRTSTSTATKDATHKASAASADKATATTEKPAAKPAAEAAKQLLANGTYLFTWAKKTKYIAKAAKDNRKSGANVMLGKKTTVLRQRWVVKYDAKTGFYIIVNEYTKKALAVKSAKKGGNVVQKTRKAGAKSQLWTVEKKGSGYVFHPAKNKKLALSVKRVKGTYNLLLAKATGAKKQRFLMRNGGIVRNGTYAVSLAKSDQLLAQVAKASKKDGADVQFYPFTGALNQKFRITYAGEDSYTLQALHSGKYLGAKGGKVVQASNAKVPAQQWRVTWTKKGLAFQNLASGKRLAADGTQVRNRTAIVLAGAAKTEAQRWQLARTKPVAENPVVDAALAKANAQGSATSYFMAVDLSNHRTMIFHRSGASWDLSKNWLCSTGRSNAPTVQGSFTVGIKGYSFGHGYTCYYYTQFYGDYLFHSVLYHEGTFRVKDGRLGQSVSAGCVRLPIDRARWIYENIPSGTRVVTYR